MFDLQAYIGHATPFFFVRWQYSLSVEDNLIVTAGFIFHAIIPDMSHIVVLVASTSHRRPFPC